MTKNNHPTFILSIIIVLLMLVTSISGLFLDSIYRDNAFLVAVWRGNDLVSLLVATPLLIASILFGRRGSLLAQLVWLGMLDYTLYNYAFYLFAASFNAFFLLYVALLVCSIFALIFGLIDLEVENLAQKFKTRTPVRWVGGYMLFVALGLTIVYFAQSIGFIFTGELPAIVIASEHPTNIVFALDLTLLVPYLILGAIWLWRRKAWGYTVASIVLVKGVVYTSVLAVGSYSASLAGFGNALEEMPLWISLTVGNLLAGLFLLGNLQRSSE